MEPTTAAATDAARITQLRKVSTYYRWLDRWVRWNRIVRRYSGYDSMTVHRLMDDPVTGHNGPFVLHNLMLQGLHHHGGQVALLPFFLGFSQYF